MLTVGAGLPIGGPALGASFGTLLSVDPVAGVDVDGVVEIAGGWVFPGLDGLPDIPEELPILHPVAQFDVPSAPGPITPGGVSTRWSRLFDITFNESAAAILPASDGLVVVGGGVSATIAWLATLDPDGVPVSQHTSGSNDLWRPVGMAYADDGDILVAGQGDGIRLDRFSPTGERRWTRTYTVPDTAQTLCIAISARSAGGAVLAGRVNRGGSLIPLLIAVHDNGDVDFAMEIDPGPGATDAELAGLAETPSGDMLAVGKVHFDDPAGPQNPINDMDAWILRLHPDATLDGYALEATQGTLGMFATRVVADADGSYAVGGQLNPAVGAANTTWLAALDAADRLRWSSSYGVRPEVGSLVMGNFGLQPTDAERRRNYVLVTGAASGSGLAIAERFMAAGRVVIDIDEDGLKAVADRHSRFIGTTCDCAVLEEIGPHVTGRWELRLHPYLRPRPGQRQLRDSAYLSP